MVREELKSVKMDDISLFMESLPPDFLAILRTDGLLRSILGKLGAPKSIRLLAYGKYAVCGLSSGRKVESRVLSFNIVFAKLQSGLHYVQLRCLLGILELLSWMDGVAQFSRKMLS